jgi:DNA helicase IV
MLELPGLLSLSPEHMEVIGQPLGSSFLVTGPPGTGKSVVAIYWAGALARSGRTTLFLMYGKMLSEYTKRAVVELGISNIVSTFHSWFPRFWRRRYHENPPMEGKWDFDWNKCLLKLMQSPPPASEKKHIVVDEGQDMPKEFYTVLFLVSESLTIFADENQRITARQSTINEILAASQVKKTLKLTTNYRNTHEIAEFSASFYAGLPTGVPALPATRGERPFLMNFPRLYECVNYIVEYENGNASRSIGVMIQRSDEAIKFYNRLESKVDNPPQIYLREGAENKKQVDFTTPGIKIITYASAKGLQFDTVFLPELQYVHGDPKGDDLRMRFYVMTSRARRTLGLMYSGESTPAIVDAFTMDLLDDRRKVS